MCPDSGTGERPRFLLMVGVPPLGPCPPRTSLRSALRSGKAARAAVGAAAWLAPSTTDHEPNGRFDALEEG